MIKLFFIIVGGILAACAALFLIPAFIALIVGAIATVVILFLIMWACGVPITITRNGVKTGYYRWTTFHPTR